MSSFSKLLIPAVSLFALLSLTQVEAIKLKQTVKTISTASTTTDSSSSSSTDDSTTVTDTDPITSMKTATFSNSNPEYSAYYSNYTYNSSEYLAVSLLLTNYDASWIDTTDGTDGVWLGIGFDNDEMSYTNVVVCMLLYNSSADN
jgi:hypothetical protein